MSNHYDAIVIGAGLGGLGAAAKLARAGYGVRVLERHGQVGGYASTFVRGRFEFEVSLHALSGIGTARNGGEMRDMLVDLGILDQLEFRTIDPLYRTVAPGVDVTLPPGWDAATDALCTAFPAERRGIGRFLNHLRALQDDVLTMTRKEGLSASPLRVISRYPRVAHAASAPLAPFLNREVRDPAARLVLAQLWGYFGLPPSQVGLLYFGLGLASYLEFGGTYPVGKSQALSNAVAGAAEAAGAEITLGCGARQILLSGGKVAGVVTDDGEHLASDLVISNASPHALCAGLLPPEAVPASFRSRVAAGPISLSSVCVYLGLARTAESLGIRDHELWLNASTDIESHYRAQLGVGAPEAYLFTCYNVTDPGASPPGTSVAVLVSLAAGKPWLALPPDEYGAAKLLVAESMLAGVEQRFPGLRDSIEELAVSTPLTNLRYTGNPDGAIYGTANTPAENPGFRLNYPGPVPGLYLVGAWTRPGGGFEPCLSSGYTAAKLIIGGVA
jgi:phytoene dehydrogenase-like protein